MNSEITPLFRAGGPAAHGAHFAMRFSSTPRGARLARLLVGQRLDAWGVPYACEAHDALTLIVAELAANAVRHGRVPGRDFHLAVFRNATAVRVEVTDTRAERVPALTTSPPTGDTGRGLILVDHLAHRWDWHPRADGPGKTVWAEYALPAGGRTVAAPAGREIGAPATLDP
ncbi:ATP-binding protein [Streptomyces sp. MI02-7b]|uniref:ATP-binding protein n=1 Tax=Streptomyces sp. MI02-7b TaxID=462941 RepID=UPI0029A12614|nr:ATP-binding protein [Streptomyces sp. MI02-7b]MDX3077502.1 ATP-binding protein [Streptomyces sp. MI02-7b]